MSWSRLPKTRLIAGGGAHEAADHFVSQNHAIACDRHFLHAALLIKRQQTVFRRTRQHLNRIRARTKDDLLRDSLPFDDFDSQPSFRADVNRALVFSVETDRW